MFNHPSKKQVPQSQVAPSIPTAQTPVAQSLPDNYAVMANLLTMLIGALTNLRERSYDVIDSAYEVSHILAQNPGYIDQLLDRVTDKYEVLDYAYHRYRLGLPKNIPDDLIQDAMQKYRQSLDAAVLADDYLTYKAACDRVQQCGDTLNSLISFKIDELKAQLSDLEVDIEVGEHTDTMSDLYPDRFKSLLSDPGNRKLLSVKTSQKASQLNGTISDIAEFITELSLTEGNITVFLSRQSVVIKQIQAFSEEGNAAQVDKAKNSLKNWTATFIDMSKSDWRKLGGMWLGVDKPASPINDIDPDNARHIRKTLETPLPDRVDSIIAKFRDLARWAKALAVSVNSAKQSGGLPDKRSKWYIGNKSIVEDLNEFKNEIVQDSVDNAASSKYNPSINLLFVFVNLKKYLQELSDFMSHDLALDVGRGDKRFQESFAKANIIWAQITAVHKSYENNKQVLGNTKTFDKAFDMLNSMYVRLSKATSDQERFANIKHIIDHIPDLEQSMDGVDWEVDNSKDGEFDFSRIELLQVKWMDLQKKYSEMMALAPDNAAMQLSHVLSNIPEPGRLLNKRVDSWLQTSIALIDKIINFAVFYIRVKSLYPMTIGMRTISGTGLDYRGRDTDNIKYVESMGALLSEALSGKSLTSTKTALLRQALEFYPQDSKVITANKMYDLATKGY